MKEVKKLLEEFVYSQADYGEIDEIYTDATQVYEFIQGYILKENLSISVLKVKNKIFLSKNTSKFDELYELIKKLCHPLMENQMVEIWEDKENKMLNIVLPSIKKHFLIRYADEGDKLGKIEDIYRNSSIYRG